MVPTHPLTITEDDTDLKERVVTFFHQREEMPLRRLRVDVKHGTAILRGHVGTRYHKQLAEECAARVAGVQHVLNQVTVEDEDGDVTREM